MRRKSRILISGDGRRNFAGMLTVDGFEAYLVGGCVRDLILNRIPKDFDIITNARLRQIKKQFHHCEIVGRRFPICRVHAKGSVVEVSSFDTVAKHSEKEEECFVPKMPKGCAEKDFILWNNSMHRDFTINSGLYISSFSMRKVDRILLTVSGAITKELELSVAHVLGWLGLQKER
ncbi:hypothetical protein FXO37_29589 [Capsicum annuum]|nr:hypothetical protein FXO37_29589 [Capsicum annuum]